MKPGERIELELEDLSYLGDGVGHVEKNLAVFAAGGLPGERVVVEIEERRPHYLRGRVRELLQSAPDRAVPPCPYFGSCGGCQLQHLAYASQVRWKEEMVRRQLLRIAHIAEPPVKPAIPAANPWNYRNQARFSVDGQGHLGFTLAHSHRLQLIESCYIMQPEIVALMPRLQGLLPGAHQILVRYGARTGQFLIAPTLPNPEPASGQPAYDEMILGRTYRVSAPSFFQVNTRVDHRVWPTAIDSKWRSLVSAPETTSGGLSAPSSDAVSESELVALSQTEVLVLLVLDRLGLTGRELVVDAYCGVGTFSLPIAQYAGQVVGIEEARSATLDAEHNAADLTNIQFLTGRTEDLLAKLEATPDAVVLDPSRAGCDPRVLAALVALRPKTIVYVSCDPATLARDVVHLTTAGYTLEEVQPVDMFPQTHHVETVSVLRAASD